jgi:hypothetical protein
MHIMYTRVSVRDMLFSAWLQERERNPSFHRPSSPCVITDCGGSGYLGTVNAYCGYSLFYPVARIFPRISFGL